MEAFFLFVLFVFVFIIFIILLNFKSSNAFNQRLIIKRLEKLNNDFEALKSGGIKQSAPEVTKSPPVTETVQPEIKKPIIVEKPIIITPKSPETVDDKREIIQKELLSRQNSTSHVTYKQTVNNVKKTDFEKFIGENLLNKIGILLFIVVLIFFGKYAVDKGWLNEAAKVVSIIIIGGILIGIAHKIRINYKAFSSVLAGGGIAALYIAIAIGFQLYSLFSQSAAFAILIVITLFAVLLSLTYDRKELAIIAIIGGFATPMLVSTGQGNYKILFSYILILDIGMLILAYFKKWNLVNFVANLATVILFGAWMANEFSGTKAFPHLGALVFVSAFYLVFFLMNVINNIKENSKFTAFEFIMLISNSFLYYCAGMIVINDLNPDYMGLYTILLALFNFAFAVPLYKRKQIDKNLVYLLIGMVLTFASIAIPVQFKGNYITMFWAAEMVLLLWLGQQSGIRLMKLASYIVTPLMFISLIMDWQNIYFYVSLNAEAMPIIINKGFITGFVVVLAILALILLLKKDEDYLYIKELSSKVFSGIYLVLLIVTLFVVLLLEIGYQVDITFKNADLNYVALACYNFVYLMIVLIWASQKKIKFLVYGLTAISVFGLLIYIFIVAPYYKQTIGSYLNGEITSSFAFFHFLTAISVIVVCVMLWKNMKDVYNASESLITLSTWFAVVIGLVVLTFELDYSVLHLAKPEYDGMSHILRQNHLIGWPILWGLIAFLLMFAGIRKNDRNLRIIGISVFFFALVKFIIVDFWDMPDGGKIIAGASLAVMLLVISFMYQKLKRLIISNEIISEEENSGQEKK